ncbi:Myb-like DNA-binding domain containing protein [Trichomonas vaginalis G3]|uniref:Myb-like DNA-binding domain containing protein n=1 Tax=Trichomonas vaginalis (strain ATCC PRA-98 / G3) TaxID=412133 RepID=A2EUC9_TRIV3|nr:RNA polymerase II transcription regulator recruiting protein [Trichomonas vaginalis G3]EAY03753.1 Myb-like DNA-binding domain containing protein [Trichomonas vaginalis G3]KAI5532709.1 RNA polymerase II transcription regulator recruiting protein [Trichomonas vaginalis G3]|eukprot:XP_001315976.1 Myb-like DNA-binding domain containing protein [Trichomonas vaginalis G3]
MNSGSHQSSKTIAKFTKDEDERLLKIIRQLGTRDWESIASCMKNRSPRQCRERWTNYLMPDLSSAPWTPEEDELLEKLYKIYGSKWSKIAAHLPNRSANIVRNRYRNNSRKIKKAPDSITKSPEKLESALDLLAEIPQMTELVTSIPPLIDHEKKNPQKIEIVHPEPDSLLISNLMAVPK